MCIHKTFLFVHEFQLSQLGTFKEKHKNNRIQVKFLLYALQVFFKTCLDLWHCSGLAQNVIDICEESKNTFKFLYEDDLTLFKKIEKIAQEIYHASEVVADTKVRQQLKDFETKGFGKLPVCIAKTQYSFSTDPNLKGAPTGHVLPIREVRLSSGAEFIVVVCGDIMTMPGLPSVPAANSIKLNDHGEIEGLF